MITEYLEKVKSTIKDSLKNKKWTVIKDEIKAEILNYLTGFSLSIEKYIDKINNTTLNIIKTKEKDLWNKYIKINPDFKEFFKKNILERGIQINEEIKRELNKCFEDTKLQIWNNKGIIDWIESFIFDEDYLKNFIDVLIKTLQKRLNYVFHLISINYNEYQNQVIRSIQEQIESNELKFKNLEPEELEKFKQLCAPKIEEIKNTFNSYLNISLFN